MKKILRLAIAQINCTVGDLEGNADKIIGYIRKARDAGADIVSFPELSITGYPPEDLLLKRKFLDDNLDALKRVAKSSGEIVVVVGFVDRDNDGLYNAAAVIYEGAIKGSYRKMMLPNYGVFDEKRYFKAGSDASLFRLGDLVFGVSICEDIWHKEGPTALQAQSANFIININASPYHAGKIEEREDVVRNRAKANRVAISYANLIGGQDELVFDGQSMVADENGRITARAGAFKEELLITDLDIAAVKKAPPKKAITVSEKFSVDKARPILPKKEAAALEPVAEIYEALILGLKDYAAKNGFKKVVLGLSGGIDSSLVAALAVDALGKENVAGVFMPTRYSSEQSESDARAVASNLGMKFITVSIEGLFKLYLAALEPQFAAVPKDITEENLQARIRGTILMALSNKFGWLVLTTGNKSEMSTGYTTLYGDMAGGLAVIKDVPKTFVYKLAKYRNSHGRAIPESVFTKEPTAELRLGQKDSDTLPPYEILDKIIKAYVEEDRGQKEIIGMGIDRNTVLSVLGMIDKSEYKRRQSPPGIKITPRAFGRDRRMPITNKY